MAFLVADDDVDLPRWPYVQMLDVTPCYDGLVVVMELDS